MCFENFCKKLLKLIENFLSGRIQSVLLNGKTSSFPSILAGVPQDSVCGPSLFLKYVKYAPFFPK